MKEEIQVGKKIFIRNAGKDEYWLQDIIWDKPDRLGLGNLVGVRKEKTQSTGGRLDILLKDPNDNTMYEVEVMLGSTDPSHIIRTISYWDTEKRRYPQRQHFAVLIAESFERRYFNVIQLLSLNVPMIAIQADLLQIGDQKVLNFTKVLDIYVEPEDEDDSKQVTKATWNSQAPWTLTTATKYLQILMEIEPKAQLRYIQSYVSIAINNRNHYLFAKRTKPNTYLWFNVKEEEKVAAIKDLLDSKNIVYGYGKYKDLNFTIDTDFVEEHKDLILQIHEIRERELTVD